MLPFDPFELFGLSRKFAMDLPQLETLYYELQKRVHPDRFVNASDVEKRVAQQWATRVNEAYTHLTDPLKRACVLCELAGVKVDAERGRGIPESFLLAQLERREMIENAREKEDQVQLQRIKAQIEHEKTKLLAEIAEALDLKEQPEAASLAIRKILFLNRQLLELM